MSKLLWSGVVISWTILVIIIANCSGGWQVMGAETIISSRMSSVSKVSLPSTSSSNEYHHRLTFRDNRASDAQLFIGFNAFNLQFLDRPGQIFIKVGDTASSSNYDFKTELMNQYPYTTSFSLRFFFNGDSAIATVDSKSMKFVSMNGRFDFSGFIDILFKTTSSPVFAKRESLKWMDSTLNDTMTNNQTLNDTSKPDTLTNDTLISTNGTIDQLATSSSNTTTNSTSTVVSGNPFFTVYYSDLKEGNPSSAQHIYQAYYLSSELVDGFDLTLQFSSPNFFPYSVYGSLLFTSGKTFEQSLLNRTTLTWRENKKINLFETISGNVPKRGGEWQALIIWLKEDKQIDYYTTDDSGSYSPRSSSIATDRKFGVGLIESPVLTGGFLTGVVGALILIYLAFSHIVIWKEGFSYDESLLTSKGNNLKMMVMPVGFFLIGGMLIYVSLIIYNT